MRWVNENREARMIGERGCLETYIIDSDIAGVDMAGRRVPSRRGGPETKMSLFITIATLNYLPYTRMLYSSLMETNQDGRLCIFCDSEEFVGAFGDHDRVELRVLPEIQILGVKRAKFKAYLLSCTQPFVYLDSDIIVLKDLSALFDASRLSACPDDLSECPFIQDKVHPWKGDPSLENKTYVNSGIFFAPLSCRDFFESLWRMSLEDETWKKYTFPPYLYDNHFLCAMINKFSYPCDFLDPIRFNWPGLRSGLRFLAVPRGNELVHEDTGRALSLCHFAGGREPKFWFNDMPSSLSAFLKERAGLKKHTADWSL